MRKLWDFWKNKKYGKKSMTGWFLLTNALLCGVIGAALWGVVSLVAYSHRVAVHPDARLQDGRS